MKLSLRDPVIMVDNVIFIRMKTEKNELISVMFFVLQFVVVHCKCVLVFGVLVLILNSCTCTQFITSKFNGIMNIKLETFYKIVPNEKLKITEPKKTNMTLP